MANLPQHYSILSNLSQLTCSMASFSSQTTLSNQDIQQSQLGSAANLFGDKHDGLFTIHKFPRLNTPSYSFKLPDSTLFLYRLKKQLTATLTSTSTTTIPTLGIAKLVLPPEISRSGDAHNKTSGIFAKDLFDEAVEEITRKALHSAQPEQPSAESNRIQSTSTAHKCPTCGSEQKEHHSTLPLKSTPFTINSTTQQQQAIQQKQQDMGILEEGDEEEELE